MEKRKFIYAPGCALMCYKPQLAEKLKDIAEGIYGGMDFLLPCCFNRPELEPGTCIVTPCATCAETYARNYAECDAEFLLTAIAESDDFPFPDYGGKEMSIQDTCSARSHPEYLAAVRKLLVRMNVTLVEPDKTGKQARCCGQVFYGKMDTVKVEGMMKKRADEMPREDVVVYCASCIMSMSVGGKRPRYIIDLLFGEETEFKLEGADTWNCKLAEFRKSH